MSHQILVILVLALFLFSQIKQEMYSPHPGQIEMTTINPDNTLALMNKEEAPYLPTYPSPHPQVQLVEEQQAQFNRVTGNILCYWLIVLCTAAIPFINLLLFFFQPFQLARGINKQNLTIDNLGRLDDFTYFYIVMGLYTFVTVVFVAYSCLFTSLWQRFKLYVMVDNIMICMLAADVAYAALHVVSFTATYSTDQQYNLVPQFIIYWQDYLIIALYCITNWAFIGIFRILMVNIYWRPWQTIIYKMSIVISSLIYIAIGLVYIFGNDSLSKQVDDFNAEVDPIIDFCFNTTEYFSEIPYFQREEASLNDAKSKIDGFIIFYVFTNFAFSFEIIAKLTDFDGTADLKTTYRLEEEEAQ